MSEPNNLTPDAMTCVRCKIPISAPHGWVAEQSGSGYFHSLDAYCIQSQAAKIAELEDALMASRTRLEQLSVQPNVTQWIACGRMILMAAQKMSAILRTMAAGASFGLRKASRAQ